MTGQPRPRLWQADQFRWTGPDESGLRAVPSCHGMDFDVFYPPEGLRGRELHRHVANAKRICRCCPLLVACRTYAVAAQEPFGVWGGTTPAERRAAGANVTPNSDDIRSAPLRRPLPKRGRDTLSSALRVVDHELNERSEIEFHGEGTLHSQ